MKSYICLLIVFCSLFQSRISLSCNEKEYDDPNFQAMINEIDKVLGVISGMVKIPVRISKAIRLIFHDCVSGCNGCVDLTAQDNKGLEWVYATSYNIYKNFVMNKIPPHKTFWGVPMSFADLLALVGCRAVYLACPECNKVDLKFCREDAYAAENKEIFSSATKSWKDQEEFFRSNFKSFNIPQDVVAIFGAHDIGTTCVNNSGFDSIWNPNTNIRLTNQFYKDLLNKETNLKYVNSKNRKGNCQWFTSGKENKRAMMLNSDMSLVLDFNADPQTGCNATCSYADTPTTKKCPRNMITSDFVELYANDATKFKEDFIVAFNKMIENGYPTGDLIDPLVTKKCPGRYYTNRDALNLILKNVENSPKKEQFRIYHFLFNKKYSLNSEEAIRRYQIFKNNLNLIKEQNSKSSYVKYGINRFFDQSVDEYLGKHSTEEEMLEIKNLNKIEDHSHLDLDAK